MYPDTKRVSVSAMLKWSTQIELWRIVISDNMYFIKVQQGFIPVPYVEVASTRIQAAAYIT